MRRLLVALIVLALATPAAGMDSILTARAGGMVGGGLTRYFQLSGAYTAQATDLYGYTWISAAGTLQSFKFLLSAAPTPGTADFTIYKNGVSQITFTASGSTVAYEPSGSFTVAAGDYVHVGCVGSATVTASDALYYCTFTGSSSNQALITGGSLSGTTNTTANRYGPCMGGSAGLVATVDDVRQVVPTGGTISHLYTALNSSITGSYTVRLYVNGSASALTVDIAGTTPVGDTTHSVSVSAGDLIAIEIVPNSPSATRRLQWGMRWNPTTDGEGLLLAGSGDALNATQTEYNWLNNSQGSWTTGESTRQLYWPAVQLSDLFVALTAVPNTGNNYAFTLRDDAADTSLTCTISDSATTGSDTSHTVTPAAGSLIDLQVVPTSTPDAADAYWGMVAYIAPPAGTTKRVMVIE